VKRALVLIAALVALPLPALAQGSGAPGPAKNAPVDKKGNAVPNEPTKSVPRTPIDKAPPEKEAPAKDKPVDKPAGSGSGSGSAAPTPRPPLQKKSPARHA